LEQIVLSLSKKQAGLGLIENTRSAEDGDIRFLQALLPFPSGLCRAFCLWVSPNLAT
jgi:hypothetical protein